MSFQTIGSHILQMFLRLSKWNDANSKKTAAKYVHSLSILAPPFYVSVLVSFPILFTAAECSHEGDT